MPRPRSSSAPSARPAASAAEPLSLEEFAGRIAACGPFEPRPHLAVAVSGGPDSLALAHLLAGWTRGQGGRLTALIVNHGLRPEAAAEAQSVAARLETRGIAARILVWQGPRPGSGVQAAARAARYALLSEACRTAGILHLALAHHRDDQAETLLQRAEAGSGPDGLAAMPRLLELPDVRLLRPLLSVPKVRLTATCNAAGLTFVEDPSNADPRFGRTEVRRRLVRLRSAGLEPAALAELAQAAGTARAAREAAVDDLLAATVRLHPAGFAELAPDLTAAPDALALRALGRVLACVGGAGWPARTARLARALASLRSAPKTALTLGGCRLVPQARGQARGLAWGQARGQARGQAGWLAVREAIAVPPLRLAPGERGIWDGRFRVALSASAPGPVHLGALGWRGWQQVVQAAPDLRQHALPVAARDVLPAFFELEAPLAVPHLDYVRDGWDGGAFALQLRPARTLSPATFAPSFTVA